MGVKDGLGLMCWRSCVHRLIPFHKGVIRAGDDDGENKNNADNGAPGSWTLLLIRRGCNGLFHTLVLVYRSCVFHETLWLVYLLVISAEATYKNSPKHRASGNFYMFLSFSSGLSLFRIVCVSVQFHCAIKCSLRCRGVFELTDFNNFVL